MSVEELDTHPLPFGELALQTIAMPKDTNANGLAGFFVPKNSKASFQASPDIFAPGNSGKYFAVRADFQAKDFPPRKPVEIRLSDEQIRTLFNRK